MCTVKTWICKCIVQVIGHCDPDHLHRIIALSWCHKHKNNGYDQHGGCNDHIRSCFSLCTSGVVDPLPDHQISENYENHRYDWQKCGKCSEFRPAKYIHIITVQIGTENGIGKHGAKGRQKISNGNLRKLHLIGFDSCFKNRLFCKFFCKISNVQIFRLLGLFDS